MGERSKDFVAQGSGLILGSGAGREYDVYEQCCKYAGLRHGSVAPWTSEGMRQW